jgi:signal transduction histidine kinase
VSPVTDRNLERLGAVAGLVAATSVGVPALLHHVQDGGHLFVGPPALWWTVYVAYVVLFASVDRWSATGPLAERRLFTVQALLGAAAVALAPGLGWTPVLLVVTGITAAFALSRSATWMVVAGSGVWLGGVWLSAGLTVADALLGVLVYCSLQAFGVLMVFSAKREAAAYEELAAANAELRATSALRAESSRSDERVLIARDLHDLVGHQLTALALELEVASHKTDPPAREHVVRASGIAKDLLGDVRAAVGELRTDTPPLRAALESLAADLPRPAIHLHVDDDLTLGPEVTTTFVRSVQEVLTNTVRHSDADNLWIEVTRGEDGATVLRTWDDGGGAPQLALGNGLTGIRERFEALGGEASFDHRGGFAVTAAVPAP